MFYSPNMDLTDFKDALRELAPLQHMLEGLSLQCLQLTEATLEHIRMLQRDWRRVHLKPNHPLEEVLVEEDLVDRGAVKIEFRFRTEYMPLLDQVDQSHPPFDLMEGFVPVAPDPFMHRSPVSLDPSKLPPLPSFLVPPEAKAKPPVTEPSQPLTGWDENPFE